MNHVSTEHRFLWMTLCQLEPSSFVQPSRSFQTIKCPKYQFLVTSLLGESHTLINQTSPQSLTASNRVYEEQAQLSRVGFRPFFDKSHRTVEPAIEGRLGYPAAFLGGVKMLNEVSANAGAVGFKCWRPVVVSSILRASTPGELASYSVLACGLNKYPLLLMLYKVSLNSQSLHAER